MNNQQNVFKNEYNFKDSAKTFLYILIYPIAIALGVLVVLLIMANILNISYAVLENTVIIKAILLLLTPAVFLGVILTYSKRNNICIYKAIPVKKHIHLITVLLVLVLAIVTIFLFSPFINLLNYLFSLFGYSPSSDLPIDISSIGWFIFAIFALAVVPGVIEELVFRGVIYNGIKTRLNEKQAIIWSSVLFMLMHGALQQSVYQLILGFILALVLYYTKNIIYSIILHFTNNLVVVISAYIYAKSSQPMQDLTYVTAFDFIAPIIYLIVGVGLVVSILALIKTTSKKLEAEYNNNQDKPVNQSETTITNQDIVEIDANNLNQRVGKLSLVTLNEKQWFYIGLGVSIVIWLINTITEII